MLVSVCVKGRDLVQAMHAADMLRTTGRKLDTILYTNLIGGAKCIPELVHRLVCSSDAVRGGELLGACGWSLCCPAEAYTG